jgi:hypothetical protein
VWHTDATQYWAKRELQDVGQELKHAPQAAVSALATAGEVVSGVAGHIVDKV